MSLYRPGNTTCPRHLCVIPLPALLMLPLILGVLARLTPPAFAGDAPLKDVTWSTQTGGLLGPDVFSLVLSVYDPVLKKDVLGVNSFGLISQPGDMTPPSVGCIPNSLKVRVSDGVIAWTIGYVTGNADEATYGGCAVYDPGRQQWMIDTFEAGDYSAADMYDGSGVVVWDNPYNPASPTSYDGTCATYDPARGQWMTLTYSVPDSDDSEFLSAEAVNGVVMVKTARALGDDTPNETTTYAYAIYDPEAPNGGEKGAWILGSTTLDVQPWSLPEFPVTEQQSVKWTHDGKTVEIGFDPQAHQWYPGPTKPLACVVPSVTSGRAPLSVWMWDMSIGGPIHSLFKDTDTFIWANGYDDFEDESLDHPLAYPVGGFMARAEVGSVEQWVNQTMASVQTIPIRTDFDPPIGSVVINGGRTKTVSSNVVLSLSAYDNAANPRNEVQLSNDGSAWTAWEPLRPVRSWTLSPGAGSRTVSARFRDAAGNVSNVATASITVSPEPSPDVSAVSTTSRPGQRSVASATLHDVGGASLANRPVTFTVNGMPVGTVLTDNTGNAALGFIIPPNDSGDPLGLVTLTGSGDGGAAAGALITMTPQPASAVWGQPDFNTAEPNVGDHGLGGAMDVAASSDGLYIADTNNNRVLFVPYGSAKATRVYGQPDYTSNDANHGGVTATSLSMPMRVAAGPDGLYVSDYGNNRVLFYPNGSTTATRAYGQPDLNSSGFGTGDTSARTLAWPMGVAVGPDGLYICDTSNGRVLFYPNGSTTATRVYGKPDFASGAWYHAEVSASSLDEPFVAAVASDGLYVADSRDNRVLFYPNGSTMATRVYGQPDFSTVDVDTTGLNARSLNVPYGVSVSANGLFVSDLEHQRVLFYPNGQTTAGRVFGQPGFFSAGIVRDPSATTLNPWGLAVHGDRLYVADRGVRVLTFDLDDTVTTIPGDANGDGDVNMGDVTAILATESGLGFVTNLQAADVAPAGPAGARGDGRIDALDALRLLRHLRGLEPAWP